MKLLVSILLLFVVALSANATTYFVDFAAGNDANNGLTTTTPFKTIPGTFNTAGNAYLNTTWGSFTSSSKVPDNTAFVVKTGTTETSATGGYVFIGANGADFYSVGCTNLWFGVTNNYGSGSTATINGTGMTIPISLFLIQVDGVTMNGLTIAASTNGGLQIKEKAGTGAPETNTVIINSFFNGNGTSATDDLSGSGEYQVSIRNAYGLFMTNNILNGSNCWSEGIVCGESHFHVNNAFIVSCIVSNLQGDVPNNDSGIGFKALNSQVTWLYDLSTANLKGFDLGENNGDGSNITYKVISCSTSNNYWGLNFNGLGTIPYTGLPINFYAINDLVVSNAYKGLHTYAGPYTQVVANNVLDNNGGIAGGSFDGVNLDITPDGNADTNLINVHIYNNIMQRPKDFQVETEYDSPTNRDTWDSDYNSYKQQSSESFALWSLSFGPAQAIFSYGANGPGHASGNWFTWFQNGVTSITLGNGHHQNDAHSKGTGSSDTTLPSLGANYTLLSPYPGTNLTSMPWFIPEMGFDRSGKVRTEWDMGSIESSTVLTINASTNIMVIGSGGNLTINGAIQTNGVTASDGTGTTTLIGTPFVMSVGTYTYSPPISSFGTTPGPFNFTVTYIGNYGTLTSATININLVQFGTTLTVGSSGSPVVVGTPVTFTASGFTNSQPIIPATGTVAFRDTTTSTSLGSVPISSGQAQITTSSLGLGTHVIQAIYSGDANYTLATNTFSQVMTSTTNLVITISPNPASVNPFQVVTYGLSVLTNGVLDISYNGISYVYVFNGVNIISQQSGNPTSGTASFTAAASNVGFTNAVATLSFSSITLTSNVIPFRQVAFGTTLTIVPSANPSIFGNAVTFTANCFTNSQLIVPATGNVDFSADGTALGSVAISGGKAQVSTSTLAVGAHTIQAIYEGDSNYTPATNTLSQQVNNPITGGGLQAFILGHFQGNITTH